MKVKKYYRRCRTAMLWVFLFVCAPFVSRAQAVNNILIEMLSYDYNCSTGMATVKYHITNSDASGHVGGYSTSYTINLGVYSTSGSIGNGDDDVEFTGGYIIGDVIECRASGVGNNFTYPMSFDYIGYKPKPVAPDIWMLTPVQICNGEPVTITATGSNGNYLWSNGQTGASITVSTAGTYSVQAVGSCGNSDPSNAIVVVVNNVSAPPVINSSIGSVICDGSSTTLSASSSGGTIHWSTGETGNSITVSVAGSYYAYEANGCGNSGNSNVITLSVAGTPVAPSALPTGPITLCNGGSTYLVANGSETFTWYLNDIAIGSGNSILVNAAGAYTVRSSNSCGSSGNSNAVQINTLTSPVAPSVTPPGSLLLCNGQSATFSSSGSNIVWSNGATGNTVVINTAGTYYAYDHNYCGNSGNSNAVVITTGNCPMPSPGTAFSICPGALKTLDAGGGYDSYLWSNGATTQTISVGPGNYAVTVWKNGCTATSVTVTVSYFAVSVPTINASGSTVFCAGNSINLSSSPGAAFSWSNGGTSNTITVNTSGSYYVKVTDGNGCQSTSAPVNVTVNPLASALIGGTNTVCKNSPVAINFNATGGTPPYTFYYNLNGGATQTISSATNISLGVPTGVAGTFVYNLLGISESSSTGCYNAASGSATITVNELPTASIAGNATVCLNGVAPQITFTGSTGNAPFIFTYTINGGANQTVSTSVGNSVSISVPTGSAGTFAYNLVSVRESSGISCSNSTSGTATVVVRPLPAASVSGSATVCQNSSTPGITFTGTIGTAPYTFTYNINGGAAQTVSTVSGNAVSVPVPTSNPGTFTYNLISVQESGNACGNTASGSATVIVNPLPTAAIAGNSTGCLNSASPLITFTGLNATAPYAFTYSINGGAYQTISTSAGNSTATLAAPTNVAGTYNYALIDVRESSSTTCLNTAAGNITVVVKPLPTATIGGTTAVCNNAPNPVIMFTGSVGTPPYSFTYNINGGANQTVTTVSGNSVSVTAPTGVVGSFIYNLVGVQESSGQSCYNVATGSATVTVNPLPTATIAGNTTVCQNSMSPNVTFTGSNATAPYTFTYRINGGANQTVSTISGNSVTVAVPTNTPGTLTYTLISVQESSGNSCSNLATGNAMIVINPQPAKAVLLSPNTHLCNGAPGQLTVYNWTNGFSYTWYRDGGLLTTGVGQTLSVTPAGSYTVLTTSDKGCDAAAVSDPVIISTGNISAPVITGQLKVCEGGKTKLLIDPLTNNNIYEWYRWTTIPLPDGRGDTLAKGPSFSAGAGQYLVMVEKEGCYDTLTVIVTANDTEFPAGKFLINPTIIPYGGQVAFMADVTGAVQYQWDLGDGQKAVTLSNKIEQTFYVKTDSVTVKMVAVSERNCMTAFTGTIAIGKPDSVIFADHAFTGNLKDWNVFPVPFHDALKLSVILKRAETVRVDLFTADGAWVRTWSFNGLKGENLFALDKINTLSAGVMYIITANYNNQPHSDKIYKN